MTRRQTELLLMRANGKTNTEIAKLLGLAENSVSLTLTAAYRNLGARDCVQAIAIALCLNEIDPYDIDVPDRPARYQPRKAA